MRASRRAIGDGGPGGAERGPRVGVPPDRRNRRLHVGEDLLAGHAVGVRRLEHPLLHRLDDDDRAGQRDERDAGLLDGIPGLVYARPGPHGIADELIDTGILPAHPDIAGQLVPGYDFIRDTAISRDGNGIDNDWGDTVDRVSFTAEPAGSSR